VDTPVACPVGVLVPTMAPRDHATAIIHQAGTHPKSAWATLSALAFPHHTCCQGIRDVKGGLGTGVGLGHPVPQVEGVWVGRVGRRAWDSANHLGGYGGVATRLRQAPQSNPSIRPSVHPSIRPSIHPSIRPSIHPSPRAHVQRPMPGGSTHTQPHTRNRQHILHTARVRPAQPPPPSLLTLATHTFHSACGWTCATAG
jgi:hypothetical protein